MLKMLDAGWPAATPAGVIADCQALGAQVVALYDANWSAAGATRTKAFLDAVDQGGVPILPICTPSNTPPDTAQDVLSIMVGQGLKHTFCAFDLETFSFPPLVWMKECVDLLHAAGWKVMGYGFQSTKNAYASCGFDYWWGVVDYSEGYGYVPPWCDAFQYYDRLIGPSGAIYDGSTVGDALATAFLADPAPAPSTGDDEMAQTIATVEGGQPNTYYVTQAGTCIHHWYDGKKWQWESVLTGCQSNDTPGVQLGLYGDAKRRDVYVRAPDGGQLHGYYVKNAQGAYVWGWDKE